MVNQRFYESLQAAVRGILLVYKQERNFRIHLICAVMALGACFLIRATTTEFLIVIVVIFLVLSAEMLNTALERVVDCIKPRLSMYAETIKDIMAGLVLLNAFLALIVASLIFLPRVFVWLREIVAFVLF